MSSPKVSGASGPLPPGGPTCCGSQLRQLQLLWVADPRLRKIRFQLSRLIGLAARLIDFGKPVPRPSVSGGALERALELLLGFVESARLHQRDCERLPHRVIPV